MSGRSCHWRDNIRVYIRVYYQHIRVYCCYMRVYCCYIRVNIHVNTLSEFLGIYAIRVYSNNIRVYVDNIRVYTKKII